MRQPDIPKKPNLTGWLWWLAILIAIVGGAVCYMLSLDTMNPDVRQKMMLVATVATIGVGICIIAATSHWWMHR